MNTYNFGDDTTPFIGDEKHESILDKLEENSELVIFWVVKNLMKLKIDNCHLLVSGTTYGHS